MENYFVVSDFNQWIENTRRWYIMDEIDSRWDLLEPYKDLIKNYVTAPTCIYNGKPYTPKVHGFANENELIKFIETSHHDILPFMVYDITPTENYNYTLAMSCIILDEAGVY